MTSVRLLLGVLLLCAVLPAGAATLNIDVRDANGVPVSDAVITLARHGAVKTPHVSPATRTVDQKDETFLPYVEVFRPGDEVRFANSDKTKHHVYSFSPARSFEMVLAPGETEVISLERPGIIAVGCNIHDNMVSYLFVSDAAFATPAREGKAVLTNVPAGDYSVRVWHPQLKRDQPEQLVTLAANATSSVAFALILRPDPRRPADRERSGY